MKKIWDINIWLILTFLSISFILIFLINGNENSYRKGNMTKYIIYKDGDIVKAENESTGNIDLANTDISKVLTSINTVISGGETIIIREGTYTPGSTVIFTKSIKIKGEGNVIFNWNTIGYNKTLFQFNGMQLGNETTITGNVAKGDNTMTVTSVGTAASGDLMIIYDDAIWNPTDWPTYKTAELHEISSISGTTITIKDSTINTFATARHGIVRFIRPITVDIDGITINGPGGDVDGWGIGLYYTKNSVIRNSKFNNCGDTSINIDRSYYTIIENNIIGNNYMSGLGYGAALSGGSAYSIIRNNRFYKSRHAIATGFSGITSGTTRDNWVIENVFDNSDGTSHVIDSHNAESYYIYNNTIYAPSDQYAISSNAKITKIIGNTIIGGYGIYPRGTCVSPGFDIEISDNKFINTQYIFRYGTSTDLIYRLNIQNNTMTGEIHAIAVVYNANHFNISGNQFDSVHTGGEEVIYLLNSTKGIISNNIIRNAYPTVVRLGSASNYNLISNNIFVDWDTGNGSNSAILINDSSYNTISNNIFSKSGIAYGPQDTGTSDYNRFLNNDLTAVGTVVANRFTIIGVNSQLKNNAGYITENDVISDIFAIDSIGVGTIIIPHGLAIKPKIQDCCLTVVKNTNVTDWEYTSLIVESVGSKNITVKIYVSKASGTVGSTAQIGMKVGKS